MSFPRLPAVTRLGLCLLCACGGNGAATSGGPDSGADSGGGIPPAGDSGADVAVTPSPDGGGDDAAAPTCGPLVALAIDAGPPNIPAGDGGCTRDLSCPHDDYCYAPKRACVSPVTVGFSAGPGTGGRADGGAACESPLALPASCDAVALEWTPSVDVSRAPGSLVESDTVLAADGKGTVLAAWAMVPDPATGPQQLNQLAVSHDDGATFTRLTTPADAPASAANDATLAYDPAGVWYYVWEGYENDFQGAQHVWLSTSTDGDHWTAPYQVDAPGDFQAGGALDFPWVAVNPATHQAYVSYEAAPSNTNGSERLIVVNPGEADAGSPGPSGDAGGSPDAAGSGEGGAPEGGAPASLSLTDGMRPNSYPDLARGVFDATGSYYAAWMELADQATETGGTLSGSTQNGIFFTRADAAMSGPPKLLASNVQVSAAKDAVNFDGPSIAVAADGSVVYVSYAVGTKDAIDVVVAASHDRGATWSPAVKVNDDPSCATHFHSSLLLDGAGRLYALWYDNRDGDGHFMYAVSSDGGATFHPNRLVSAPTFPFDTFQYSTGWLGDYYAPALTGTTIYALWSDGRESDQSHAFLAKAALP